MINCHACRRSSGLHWRDTRSPRNWIQSESLAGDGNGDGTLLQYVDRALQQPIQTSDYKYLCSLDKLKFNMLAHYVRA